MLRAARPPHGSVQALTEVRRSDIVALHKRLFVGSNMVVAVVGNVESKKAMAQIEKVIVAKLNGDAFVVEDYSGEVVRLTAIKKTK